jgi:hypothetical protein
MGSMAGRAVSVTNPLILGPEDILEDPSWASLTADLGDNYNIEDYHRRT